MDDRMLDEDDGLYTEFCERLARKTQEYREANSATERLLDEQRQSIRALHRSLGHLPRQGGGFASAFEPLGRAIVGAVDALARGRVHRQYGERWLADVLAHEQNLGRLLEEEKRSYDRITGIVADVVVRPPTLEKRLGEYVSAYQTVRFSQKKARALCNRESELIKKLYRIKDSKRK